MTRHIFLSGPEDDLYSEPSMKFRLTYAGPLRPTQRDARDDEIHPLAPHKQEIRRHFHRQLKHLWSTNRYLREREVFRTDYVTGRSSPPDAAQYSDSAQYPDGKLPLRDAVAAQYHRMGYRFVPLVRESVSLLCSLDILFLRRDIPGSVLSAGDLDNRIKTLIDTLRIPQSQNELIEGDAKPGPDEDPFFCLMEDDKQVSRLTVETDTLLLPPGKTANDHSETMLIITVDLRPYNVTQSNLSFAGA
jgi:hypothetical protein